MIRADRGVSIAVRVRRFSSSIYRWNEEQKQSVPNATTSIPYSVLTLGIPREIYPNERRVAITPQNAALLLKKGFGRVLVERGAGAGAQFTDQAYEHAGATLAERNTVWSDSDILLKVRAPNVDSRSNEVDVMRKSGTLLSLIYPAQNPHIVNALAAR